MYPYLCRSSCIWCEGWLLGGVYGSSVIWVAVNLDVCLGQSVFMLHPTSSVYPWTGVILFNGVKISAGVV